MNHSSVSFLRERFDRLTDTYLLFEFTERGVVHCGKRNGMHIDFRIEQEFESLEFYRSLSQEATASIIVRDNILSYIPSSTDEGLNVLLERPIRHIKRQYEKHVQQPYTENDS